MKTTGMAIVDYIITKFKEDFKEKLPTISSIDKYFKEHGNFPEMLTDLNNTWEGISLKDALIFIYGEEEYYNSLYFKRSRAFVGLEEATKFLEKADEFAIKNTTDPSIYVGALIGTTVNGTFVPFGIGANANPDYNEKELGQTYREFMFKSRDKKYRPWDRIIHAEENAILNAMKNGYEDFDTAFVTRYPCEKCAQLMVYKGIKTVYYGRKFKISEETEQIFKDNNIVVFHIESYEGQADDDNK